MKTPEEHLDSMESKRWHGHENAFPRRIREDMIQLIKEVQHDAVSSYREVPDESAVAEILQRWKESAPASNDVPFLCEAIAWRDRLIHDLQNDSTAMELGRQEELALMAAVVIEVCKQSSLGTNWCIDRIKAHLVERKKRAEILPPEQLRQENERLRHKWELARSAMKDATTIYLSRDTTISKRMMNLISEKYDES